MKGLQIISEGRTQTEERRVEAEDIYGMRLILKLGGAEGGSRFFSVR